MSFHDSARTFALAKAAELEAESRKIGILRSVDATEASDWLASIAKAIREAAEPERPRHYPPGMGEESRRLHREYNALVEAQRNGAKNGAEVVSLTDECAAKGIILIPGGENL